MPEQSTITSFVPGRCGVVGLGLMGGSFARAFRAAGREVFAWNRTRSTLELAEIETVTGELTDDVIGTCELIIRASRTPAPPCSKAPPWWSSRPRWPTSSAPTFTSA